MRSWEAARRLSLPNVLAASVTASSSLHVTSTRSCAGGKPSPVRAPYKNRQVEPSTRSKRRIMDEQSKSERPKTTKLGYCNPPEQMRFRKGQSGNPQGRPKGSLNMATVLERTLREKVIINENGRRKTITKLEAAIKQLINKAASGELKAFQLLAALVRAAEERAVQAPISKSVLEEVDEKVFLGILKRLEVSGKKDQGDSD